MNEELLKLESLLEFHQKEINRIVNQMIEQTRLSVNPMFLIDFEDKLKIKIIDSYLSSPMTDEVKKK
jgi:hypothetical protein